MGSRAWTLLVLAGLFEVVWAIGLKYAEGFTKPVASAVTLTFMVASMELLSQAMRALPAGTAYAVWTGIGAVGTAIVGMVLLGEPRTLARVACIGLIVAGIVGLKLAEPK